MLPDPSADQATTGTDGWVAPVIIVLALVCVVTGTGLAWHRTSTAETSGQRDGLDPGTTVMVENPLFTRDSRRSRRKKKILTRLSTAPENVTAEAEMAVAKTATPAYGALDPSQQYAAGGHHIRNDNSLYARLGENTPASAEMAAATPTCGALDPSQQYAAGGTTGGKMGGGVGGHGTCSGFGQRFNAPTKAKNGDRGNHPRTGNSLYARLAENTPAEAEMAAAKTAAPTYGELDPSKQYTAGGHHPRNDDSSSYARLARNDVSATAEVAYEVLDDEPEYASAVDHMLGNGARVVRVMQHTHAGGSGPQSGAAAVGSVVYAVPAETDGDGDSDGPVAAAGTRTSRTYVGVYGVRASAGDHGAPHDQREDPDAGTGGRGPEHTEHAPAVKPKLLRRDSTC